MNSAKENPLKILVLTNVFPCEQMPNVGFYIKNQIDQLREYCDMCVVMGLPRDMLSARGREDSGLSVVWPNVLLYIRHYLTLKKVGVLFSGYSYIQATKKIVDEIYRDFPFDMIISYWTYPEGMAANYYGKKYNVPVMLRPRGSDINVFAKYLMLRKRITKVLQGADKVIPVSGHLKNEIAGMGVSEEKISFIRNGVEKDKFFPQDKRSCRESLSLDPERKMIIYIGNLYEVKGIDYFMRALRMMDDKSIDADVYIIGKGYLLPAVEKAKDKLKNVKIFIQGTVAHKDLNPWINAADLLCLPSVHEGCPNVVLEALTCGTPVVASAVGGVPELITDDSLGILVPARYPKELAEALERALDTQWDKEEIIKKMPAASWQEVGRDLFKSCQAMMSRMDTKGVK